MWAVGDTFVAIFLFARNIHFSPTCTGADDDRFAFQYRAISDLYFNAVACLTQSASTL